jgi:hypothetical protein
LREGAQSGHQKAGSQTDDEREEATLFGCDHCVES